MLKKVEKLNKEKVNIIEEISDYLQHSNVDQIVVFLQNGKFTSGDLIKVCREKKFTDAKKLNRIAFRYDKAENEKQAFEIYEFAAMLGDRAAMGNVAFYYFEGLSPCQKDLDKALIWCEKAIVAKDIERNILKAKILRQLGKYEEAVNCLKEINEGLCSKEEVQEAAALNNEINEEVKNHLELRKSFEEYNSTISKPPVSLVRLPRLGLQIQCT